MNKKTLLGLMALSVVAGATGGIVVLRAFQKYTDKLLNDLFVPTKDR